MDLGTSIDILVDAGLSVAGRVGFGIKRSTIYEIECYRKGKLIWIDRFHNLVVTEGLNDSLAKHFKGSGYTAAWYVGLTGNTPTFAAGDVMTSHSGWTEVTNYDEAARPTLTLGTPANGSVDNSASKAVFTISTGGANVGGAFIVFNSTKGGTTGPLYGGGAISQNRALLAGDVLNVTVTLTAATA